MIFWVMKKLGDQDVFMIEYKNRESAYKMADFLNWLNPGTKHWVLEIN